MERCRVLLQCPSVLLLPVPPSPPLLLSARVAMRGWLAG